MKFKNPLGFRFKGRPPREEFESDEEWFEAEVKWWERRERMYRRVVVVGVVLAVAVGVVVALSGCGTQVRRVPTAYGQKAWVRDQSVGTKVAIDRRVTEMVEAVKGVRFAPLTVERAP